VGLTHLGHGKLQVDEALVVGIKACEVGLNKREEGEEELLQEAIESDQVMVHS
jgi:hypothetical protein